MQSLIILSLLGTAATAAGPVTVQVEAHALANTSSSKTAPQATDLLERGTHGMSARIGSDGRIQYDCDNVGAAPAQRLDARTAHKED